MLSYLSGVNTFDSVHLSGAKMMLECRSFTLLQQLTPKYKEPGNHNSGEDMLRTCTLYYDSCLMTPDADVRCNILVTWSLSYRYNLHVCFTPNQQGAVHQ